MIKITRITTAEIAIQRKLNKSEEQQLAEKIRSFQN